MLNLRFSILYSIFVNDTHLTHQIFKLFQFVTGIILIRLSQVSSRKAKNI